MNKRLTGPEWARCPYCRKAVKVGRWLGTWHVCLDPADRAEIDRQWAFGRWQMEAQRHAKPMEWGELP